MTPAPFKAIGNLNHLERWQFYIKFPMVQPGANPGKNNLKKYAQC